MTTLQQDLDRNTGPAAPIAELSVVVVFARRFAVLRRTLAHLRAQTIADRIELVIMAPSAGSMQEMEPRDTAGLHSVRVCVVGEIVNVDKAGARGIAAASAPVIAFMEDHAFPAPNWAETVVRAHREEWGVVGTAIVNGNPRTGWSWANHLVTYGPWAAHVATGEVPSVSRHNTSFKREALHQLGGNLLAAFGCDGTLLKDLRRANHRIYLDTGTTVAHVNPSRAWTTLGLRFNAGRLYADKRVKAGRWGIAKRAAYAAAAPLYPLIRFRQIWGETLRHPSHRPLLPRVLPALTGALIADAVGQAVGYATGAGRSVDTLADFEAERLPHLVTEDHATLLEDGTATALSAPAAPAVRIAVIGCGRVVQISHLRSLASLPDVRVVALAEPDESRREEAARRTPSARAHADWASVISDPEVDAVLIAAPPALHADMAVAAFAAGKHVYLEKPIAPSLADAARIVDAWRAAGRVGMIGHNLRCHPLYTAARNRLEQGHIGTPIVVRTAFTAALRGIPEWKRAMGSGGGVVLDLATHHVDLCRFLLGEDVADAELEEWGQHFDGDSALLRMRMQSGVRVESFFSLCAVSDDQCEVTGDKGRLVIDRYAGSLRFVAPRQSQGIRARLGRESATMVQAAKRALQPPGEPSYRASMARFIRAVREGGVALPDLADGYRALEIVLGARHRR